MRNYVSGSNAALVVTETQVHTEHRLVSNVMDVELSEEIEA